MQTHVLLSADNSRIQAVEVAASPIEAARQAFGAPNSAAIGDVDGAWSIFEVSLLSISGPETPLAGEIDSAGRSARCFSDGSVQPMLIDAHA